MIRPFQNAVRVFFHQHPVFEGARLGFIGVADHIFRLAGRLGGAFPFHAGREGRSAAPDQPGGFISAITAAAGMFSAFSRAA